MIHELKLVSERITEGIERFSARKNFSKILQVSHFHLGFSPAKNNNETTHSHMVFVRDFEPIS